jgi:hypothetical protein|tara:strand:+ start:198 stop:482 length:285 start_codon:yes stop_codon:yes gene_type:complete
MAKVLVMVADLKILTSAVEKHGASEVHCGFEKNGITRKIVREAGLGRYCFVVDADPSDYDEVLSEKPVAKKSATKKKPLAKETVAEVVADESKE